jgi:hypothetical protein
MKRLLSFSLIVLVSMSLPGMLSGAQPCECGTHATGIYTWSVANNSDCCSSTIGGGMLITYVPGAGGTWKVDTTTPYENGGDAQSASPCCKNT